MNCHKPLTAVAWFLLTAALPAARAHYVDPWSGRLALSANDLSVSAGAQSLDVARIYTADGGGPWGDRWLMSWAVSASVDRETVIIEEGALALVFLADGRGGFQNPAGGRVTVEKDGGLVRARAEGGQDVFDRSGRIVRRQARDGAEWTFDYDDGGRLMIARGPFGTSLRFGWSGEGRITTVEGSDGQTAHYTYASNRLAEVALNGAKAVAYTYDEAGRLASRETPSEGLVRFLYDAEGRVAKRAWVDGAETYTWNAKEREAERRDAMGGVTRYQRSADGRRDTTTYPDGTVRVEEKDEAGRVLRVLDGEGSILQRNTYDARGRLTRVEDALGQATAFAYVGDSSDFASMAWPDGGAETFAYDGKGRLVRTSRDGRVTEERIYGDDGLLKRVTRGSAWEAWTHDASGRVTEWRAHDGRRLTYERDARGRAIREVDEAGRVTERTYDAQGRLLAEVQQPGGTTQYAYGPNGLLDRKTDPLGRITAYRHDERGRLVELVDAAGGTNRYVYDQAGQLVSVVNPEGHAIRLDYDAAGNLVGDRDPDGAVLQRRYDFDGRLLEETERSGGRSRYEYDAGGRLTAIVNPAGGRTTMTYDGLTLASVTDPAGRSFRFECGAACEVKTESDGEGNTWRHDYDHEGRKIRTIDPLGGVTEWVYDEAGRLARVRQPAGGDLRYAYDDAGRLARVTDPAGDWMEYAYDARGLVTSEKDSRGRETRFDYDALGRKTKTTLPGGATRTLEYDAMDQVVRFVDEDGVETRHTYDAAGRRSRTVTSTGLDAHFTYDAAGSLQSSIDNLGEGEFFACDADGRVIASSNRAGVSHRFVRDAMGQVVETRDALGRKRTRSYDAAGLLAAATEPNGDEARFTYDKAGRLRTVRSPGGGVATYVMNAADGVASATDPLGRTASNAYDKAGRVVDAWNARGQRIALAYDDAGRLLKRGAAGAKAVSFEHNLAGLVTAADDGEFPVRITYGPDLLPQQVAWPAAGASLRIARDARGRRTHQEGPGGSTDYRYDDGGRLAEMQAGSAVVAFTFDAKNRLTALRFPNGLVQDYAYGAAGDVARVRLSKDGAAPVEWHYERDAAGNVIRLQGPEGETLLAYDAADQLAEARGPSGHLRYRYAPGGNRAVVIDGDREARWTVNAADQVVQAGDETFAYDEDGNVVERRSPAGVTRYAYDAENRLVKVVRPDGATIEYGYDHQGLRVSRRDASGLRYYLYDGPNLVAEQDEKGTLVASYVHGFGANQPLLMTRDGKSYSLHADANGSVVRITDENGAVVASRAYDSFGVTARAEGSVACTYGFQGHEYDEAAGLYYCRARWYDPKLGRFLTRDPVPGEPTRPISLNPYIYVLNNPWRYTDPYGASPDQSGGRDPASMASHGVLSGMMGGTPYGTPPPSPNAIQMPAPSTYTVSGGPPSQPGTLGEYWRHNPNVGDDIKIYPEAGRTQARFDGTVVHETQHRTDVNRMMQWLANKLDHGLDPSKAADRKFLDLKLQQMDPDYLARLERRAIERQTTFLVRDRGLNINSREVQEALRYFEKFGTDEQKQRLVRELQRFQNDPTRVANARFQNFMKGASIAAVALSFASCMELGKSAVDCAKEAAIAGVAGHIIASALVGMGLNPAVILGAAGIHGWVKVGQEGAAQWRDYTNRTAQAAANAAQQATNDARVAQTLDALRGQAGQVQANAAEANSAYQAAQSRAHAAAAAARGGSWMVKEAQRVAAAVALAATSCAEAQQLLATIGARAANAERYEGLVEDGMNAASALAGNCKSKQDAQKIMDLYTTAAKLVGGMASMEADSQIDSDRIRQIVQVQLDARAKIGEVEGHPAALADKVQQAQDEVAKATAAYASFETKRQEAETLKSQVLRRITALKAAHGSEHASDFDAIHGQVAAVAVPAASSGEALATAQGELAAVKTSQADAQAAVSAAKGAALCDTLSTGDELLGRIGTAHTGAFIHFGAGSDLPSLASACEQAVSTGATATASAGPSGSGTGGDDDDDGSDGTDWGPSDTTPDDDGVGQAGGLVQAGQGAGPGGGAGGPSAGEGGAPIPPSVIGADIPDDESTTRTGHGQRPGDHAGRPQSGAGTGDVPDPFGRATQTVGQVASAAGSAQGAVGIAGGWGRDPGPSGGSGTGGTQVAHGTGKPPMGGGTGGGGGGTGDDGDNTGGGAGGGGGKPPSGPGGGGDTVVVTGTGQAGDTSGATASGSGGFANAPQDQVIDGSAQIGGRTVTGVKVTLTYQAYSIVDQFQIIYEDRTIGDTGVISGAGTLTESSAGSSPQVKIRVLTPDSGTAWKWSATVAYSVK